MPFSRSTLHIASTTARSVPCFIGIHSVDLAAVFDGLARMLRAAPQSEAPSAAGQPAAGSPEAVPVLGDSILALDLSVRATTYLELSGIRTIGE